MIDKFLNRAWMTVSGAPGQGPVTVGVAHSIPVGGGSFDTFLTFEEAGAEDGEEIRFEIRDDGVGWEIFKGTYTAGVITRDTVEINSLGTTAKLFFTSNATIANVLSAVDLTIAHRARHAIPADYGAPEPDGNETLMTGTDMSPYLRAMIADCADRRAMRIPAGIYALNDQVFFSGEKHIDIEFEAGAVLMASTSWNAGAWNMVHFQNYGDEQVDYTGHDLGDEVAARKILRIVGPGKFDCRQLRRQGVGSGSAGLAWNGNAWDYIEFADLILSASGFHATTGEPIHWRATSGGAFPGGDTGISGLGGKRVYMRNIRGFGFPDATAYLSGDYDSIGELLHIENCHSDMSNFGYTAKRAFKKVKFSECSVRRAGIAFSLLFASIDLGTNADSGKAHVVADNWAEDCGVMFWFENQDGLICTGNKLGAFGKGGYDTQADSVVRMFRLDGVKDSQFSHNICHKKQTTNGAQTANNSTSFSFALLDTFSQDVDGALLTRHSTGNRFYSNYSNELYAGIVEADSNQNDNISVDDEFVGSTVPWLLKGASSKARSTRKDRFA